MKQEWLIEYLRSAVAATLDQPAIAQLSPDLFSLGFMKAGDADVPIYLARRLLDEKAFATSDVLLRAAGEQGIGLVLDAGEAPFRCLGANVLCRLIDQLSASESTAVLDAGSMRTAFRAGRHLARGGQAVELVWDGGERGELFIPGRGSIQIPGRNRLIVVDRLVKAYKSGAPAMKTQALNHDLGGVAIRNIFGPSLWKRLSGTFIRSAGHGAWEIAA